MNKTRKTSLPPVGVGTKSAAMCCCAVLLQITVLVTSFGAIGGVSLGVSQYGVDNKTCLSGITACNTLDYILRNLATVNDSQVSITVEYDQEISAVSVTIAANKVLAICGVNFPMITSPDEGQASASINMTGDHGITSQLRLTNLHFTKVTSGFHFESFHNISVDKCTFSDCGDLIVTNTANVLFNECKFAKNQFERSTLHVLYDECVKSLKPEEHTVEILNTMFNGNIGLLDGFFANGIFSVLGVAVSTNGRKLKLCTKASIAVFVRNCSFTNTAYTSLNRQAAAFALDISGPVSNSSLLLDRCTFADNAAGVMDIRSNRNEGQMTILIQGSVIVNNSLMMESDRSLSLVNFVFNTVSLNSNLSVNLSNNLLSNNNGAGLMFTVFKLSESSYTQFITIDNSTISETTGPALSVVCLGCAQKIDVYLLETILANNLIPDLRKSTVTMDNCVLHIENCTFINNTGTGLKMTDTKMSPSGLIVFDGNIGIQGGGAHLGNGVTLDIGKILRTSASLVFENNVALYGGALYLTSSFVFLGSCVLNQSTICNNQTIRLINNSATVAGYDMFLMQPDFSECVVKLTKSGKCNNVPGDGFASVTERISFYNISSNISMLSVFPGQNIAVDVSVLDAYGNPSTCLATVVLRCGREYVVCRSDSENSSIQIDGPGSITLTDGQQISSLQILSPNGNLSVSPQILFQCEYAPQAVLTLDIIACPLGFEYNATAKKCDCAIRNSYVFQCSNANGLACVAQGYWFGRVNSSDRSSTVVSPCHYSHCTTNTTKCPLAFQNSTNYILLPPLQDGQCTGSHGGVLCGECTEGAYPSFQASQCVPCDQCNEKWQAPLLLLLAISFQLLLSIILMFFVRYTKSLGVLYGPLFFAAVVNHLPFGRYLSLNGLKVIIPFFSFYLLNLSAIGQIPWCFFKSLNQLENFAFQFLGPAISALVMLANVACAQRCPRLQKKLKITPIQTLCLLAILSFWTVADSSIEILKVQTYNGINNTYVLIQPSLMYSDSSHVAMVTVSVLLLAFLVLPFVLLLLLAPIVSRKINLSRIQPFLDVFQSSFKDRFRWYPAVYLVTWILFLSTSEITNSTTASFTSQLFLMLIAIAHLLFEPFRKRHNNTINTVLFFDLIALSLLVSKRNSSNEDNGDLETYVQVLVYILTLTPLILFMLALGTLLLPKRAIMKFSKAFNSRIRRRRKFVMQDEEEKVEYDENSHSAELASITSSTVVFAKNSYVRLRESLLDSV